MCYALYTRELLDAFGALCMAKHWPNIGLAGKLSHVQLVYMSPVLGGVLAAF